MATAAASDQQARVLDQLQVETDEGPCLDAIRTGRRVIVGAFGEDERYPSFGAAAHHKVGMRSCLSLPLRATQRVTGSFNLYGRQSGAYGDDGDATAAQLAQQAAKGILMARSRIDADQAFDVLRRASQRQNVKLREVARQIVENVQQPPSGAPH